MRRDELISPSPQTHLRLAKKGDDIDNRIE